MSKLEPSETIEQTVGTTRRPTEHVARAVSAEQRVYILHSQECFDSGIDLRECVFSRALDLGIDLTVWSEYQNEAVFVAIDDDFGDLFPMGIVQ